MKNGMPIERGTVTVVSAMHINENGNITLSRFSAYGEMNNGLDEAIPELARGLDAMVGHRVTIQYNRLPYNKPWYRQAFEYLGRRADPNTPELYGPAIFSYNR